MIAKIEKCVFVGMELKEGVGKKSGKDYSFYQVRLADEKYNLITCNVSKKLTENPDNVKLLLGIHQKEVSVEVDLKPKGFDVSAEVLSVDTH